MRTISRIAWAVFLGLLLVSPVHAERVIRCHDGDTCTLNTGQRIRIAGIDAPELSQADGRQARNYLMGLVLEQDIDLHCTGYSYRRRVCTPYRNGLNIAEAMVRSGWAYDYARYSNGRYAFSELLARLERRGVWEQSDGGVRPWAYRRAVSKRSALPLQVGH